MGYKNSSSCKIHVVLQPKWTSRLFELKRWLSNQNSFILSGKFIGAHLRAHCSNWNIQKSMKMRFSWCACFGERHVRARTYNVKKRVVVIQEILFDYYIAILAQKIGGNRIWWNHIKNQIFAYFILFF